MTTQGMLEAIDEEIQRLQMVRSLLGGEETPARRGRKPKEPAAAAKKKVGRPAGSKRALSPEARERIAEAQRKRWAASKKAAKRAAKQQAQV